MPHYHLEESKEIIIDTIISMFKANTHANELKRHGNYKDAALYLSAQIITVESIVKQADDLRSKSRKFEQEGKEKGQLTKEAKSNQETVDRIDKIDNLRKVRDATLSSIMSTKKILEEGAAPQLPMKQPPMVRQEKAIDQNRNLAIELARKEQEFTALIGKDAYEYFKSILALENYLVGLNKAKPSRGLDLDDSISHLSEVEVGLKKVIDQLKFSAKDSETLKTLTVAAVNTHLLLTNKLSFTDYDNIAKTMQGKASPGLKILGGLMIALGCAVAVAGAPFIASALAAFVTGAMLNSVAVGLGLSIAAIGVVPGTILFSNNKLRHDGLYKDMHDLNMAKLNDSPTP